MSTLAPNLAVKDPRSRDAGGGIPPSYGGGGNGNEGGASNGAFNYGERLRRARLGLVLGLTAVLMLFVGFTSALLVRKGLPSFDAQTNTYSRDWTTTRLPWTLLLVNTAVLLLSSVTMEFARRAITRRAALAPVKSIPGISLDDEHGFPWLGMTVVLGLGFLAGQLLLWEILRAHSFFVNTNPSSSFTYLLFATHAIHLAGGVLALAYAASASWLLHKPIEAQRIVVDVTAWYWHFMALLWIYILVLLAVVR
jgi:cytochrome c oxidase subunit III